MKIEKIASNAEYASIGLSFLGSIAAIATQQVAYISAPLVLSASLSLLNRRRELGRTNQHIVLLEQQLASHHRSTIDQINILQKLVLTTPLAPPAANNNQQIVDIYNRIGSLDYSIEDLKDNNFRLTSQIEDYQKYNLIAQTALSSELNNNLVREIADHLPNYEYELVLGREQSRQALLEALASVENRLILVCPWLCHHGFDLEIQNQLEQLLVKGVTIEIGYGKLSDIEKGKLTGFFYNSLRQATDLANKYRNYSGLKKVEDWSKMGQEQVV